MLFAYFGPDTMLPLASTLVAIAGFVLMCGRQAVRFPLLLVRRLTKTTSPEAVVDEAQTTVEADGKRVRLDHDQSLPQRERRPTTRPVERQAQTR